jgi:hypothetical protein
VVVLQKSLLQPAFGVVMFKSAISPLLISGVNEAPQLFDEVEGASVGPLPTSLGPKPERLMAVCSNSPSSKADELPELQALVVASATTLNDVQITARHLGEIWILRRWRDMVFLLAVLEPTSADASHVPRTPPLRGLLTRTRA